METPKKHLFVCNEDVLLFRRKKKLLLPKDEMLMCKNLIPDSRKNPVIRLNSIPKNSKCRTFQMLLFV